MSESSQIVCPNCQVSFELTSTITQQLAEKVQAKFAAREQALALKNQALLDKQAEFEALVAIQVETQKAAIAAEQQKKAQDAIRLQMADLQTQLREQKEKIAVGEKKELALMGEKRALEAARQSFEIEKQKQLDAERGKIREEAAKHAVEATSTELAELKQSLLMKDQLIESSRKAELELRKQKNELDEQKKALDVELARQADFVKNQVAREKDEEYRLKQAEAQKKTDELMRQIDELKRKAEQGSQQSQGEVLELDLENKLKTCMSRDQIIPVAKGVLGADVLQHVFDDFGRACGTIIWESKRTKNWSDGWLSKLKDDRREAKAQLAVLVSTALPRDLISFECRDDVWITSPALALPLAAALRIGLIETATAQRAGQNRSEKMAVLYDYIASREFQLRIGSIVETFRDMQNDLEAEKRSLFKLWAKRQKQIERVVLNSTGLHGELQGILGAALPTVETMELLSIADERSEADENLSG